MRHGRGCLRIRNATIERALARLAVVAARALFATVRRKTYFADATLSPYAQPGPVTCIYSVWHDSLLVPLFLGRQPATKALVGRHQDGTFLANSLTALGISSVRGSSSNGGAQAVRQLIDETQGCHIVVTPDGPRGPQRQMKSGIAFLAAHTGKVVVPTAFACTRSWSWGAGWTHLMVPKPGSTVVTFSGTGIAIPQDAARAELNDYTGRIQSEMDRLNLLADRVVQALKSRTALPEELKEFVSRDTDLCRQPGLQHNGA